MEGLSIFKSHQSLGGWNISIPSICSAMGWIGTVLSRLGVLTQLSKHSPSLPSSTRANPTLGSRYISRPKVFNFRFKIFIRVWRIWLMKILWLRGKKKALEPETKEQGLLSKKKKRTRPELVFYVIFVTTDRASVVIINKICGLNLGWHTIENPQISVHTRNPKIHFQKTWTSK